jgi:hypothetical protein
MIKTPGRKWKDARKGSHFLKYKQGWVFYTAITTSEASMATWNELRLFFGWMVIKPKTIGAFQQNQQPFLKNNGIEW